MEKMHKVIDTKSLEAFMKMHKLCFRDREDSTRVYPPGNYIGKGIAWNWITAKVDEWNKVMKEISN